MQADTHPLAVTVVDRAAGEWVAEGGVVFLCSELAHRRLTKIAAAATIAAAGQLGGGGGEVLGKMSMVQSHPQANLWAEKCAHITTPCPLLTTWHGQAPDGWLQAGLWSQVPCVQVQVLPCTTRCDSKQRAPLFTPILLCVKMV